MLQRMGVLLRLLALLCLSGTLHAETTEFPKQAITLLVPYAAGGPSDSLARVVAKSMTHVLGQPVNVSNMGGKGGTIGSLWVAKAPADGYPCCFTTSARQTRLSSTTGCRITSSPISNPSAWSPICQ